MSVAPTPIQLSDHLVEFPDHSAHDFQVALHKDTCNCTTHYLSQFVFLARLSTSYCVFFLLLIIIVFPCLCQKLLHRLAALKGEMPSPEGPWDLVSLPLGKKVIGCKWIVRIKLNPDGMLARLKACIVAKGYSHVLPKDILS